jgi:hypothetical protein
VTLNKLKKILNDLSWDEQMEFEMSERDPNSSQNMREKINQKIRELAVQLTPSLLDILEQDKGYLVWVLRLSPHVPGDAPKKRAQRFVNHQDSEVRFWANKLMQTHEL